LVYFGSPLINCVFNFNFDHFLRFWNSKILNSGLIGLFSFQSIPTKLTNMTASSSRIRKCKPNHHRDRTIPGTGSSSTPTAASSAARCSSRSADKLPSGSRNATEGQGSQTHTQSPITPINHDELIKTKTNEESQTSEPEAVFEEHTTLTKRMAKSFYYGRKVPMNTRPSFPLTVLAVNAFTTGTFGTQLDTLQFLDLDMASEVGRSACVSPTTLIMALVYLDRLSKNNVKYLEGIKPSELFVVALLVANKFIQDEGEDSGIYNDEWAASGRLDVKKMNRLELEFLCAMDWNININPKDYNNYLSIIESKLALTEGNKRGWYTYTEIDCISDGLGIDLGRELIGEIVKITTAASIAYISIIATILASSVLLPQVMMISSGIVNRNVYLIGNDTCGKLDLSWNRFDSVNDTVDMYDKKLIEVNCKAEFVFGKRWFEFQDDLRWSSGMQRVFG